MDTTGTLWSMAQNAPLVVLLVSAVWHWAHQKQALAVSCTIAGGVASGLLIRSRSPIANDYNEPWGVTTMTIASMSLLQGLLAAYLATEADWSNWKVDIALGSVAGASFALARGLTPPTASWPSIVRQAMGLTAAGVLVLLGIRKLKGESLATAMATALLIAVVTTLVLRAVGYQLVLE